MATHVKGNKKQVVNNIALAIHDKPKKIKQLIAVQSITINCTSDDHIEIDCELYAGNIARYIVKGTRCNTTITVNTITNEIIRKPRNIKPIFITEIYWNVWAADILERIAELNGITLETLFNRY